MKTSTFLTHCDPGLDQHHPPCCNQCAFQGLAPSASFSLSSQVSLYRHRTTSSSNLYHHFLCCG
uniref:Uncharacterized protein n=1 Tax=Arundo donax TaxID=35708 RepID=A0A0A9DF25_ARUDO